MSSMIPREIKRARTKAIAALNRRRAWLFAALKEAGVWPLPSGIGMRIYALEAAAAKKGAASARWSMHRDYPLLMYKAKRARR